MSFKENFDWNIHKAVGNRVISLVSQCPQLERNVIIITFHVVKYIHKLFDEIKKNIALRFFLNIKRYSHYHRKWLM